MAKTSRSFQRNPPNELLEQFLKGGNTERLADALAQPDVKIASVDGRTVDAETTGQGATETPIAQTEAVVAPRVEETPKNLTPPPAPETPIPVATTPAAVAPPVVERPIDDAASIALPETAHTGQVTRRHKRYGNRTASNAVDMTLSLDPEHAQRITELTAYEMLRTKGKVSTSEIVRQLLDFALSHVENNTVIPTSDGLGLHNTRKGN